MENLGRDLLEKTEKSKVRFDELTDLIIRPEVIADNREWRKLVKERSPLEELANAHYELKNLVESLESCEKDFASESDAEMKALFETEIDDLKEKIEEKVEEIKILLLPKDENDDSNAIIEIRAAAGGEESALFGLELCRMYSHYADKKHWKVEYIDMNETELGGIKEATIMIKGKGAFSRMKYECGVHRVQRVPETESQGRIHTSTTTVAVLPEVEEVDFEILDKDLRIDVFHSGGAGGQNVNKTESAVRITHIPSGIVVACQVERSQLQNREIAMNLLKARLNAVAQAERDEKLGAERRLNVGSGERSEKIRSYNYPQNRVTDHRIGFTIQKLDRVMEGDLDEIFDALTNADQQDKLEQEARRMSE